MREITSHHEYLPPDAGVKLSSDRTFGVVLGVFFALIALVPLMRGRPVRWWGVAVSLAFFALALALPVALHALNVAWSKLALILQHVVSPVAMALLFFFGFAVTGAILRAFGKDLLRLKPLPGQDSYWIKREPPGPAPESMLHQF